MQVSFANGWQPLQLAYTFRFTETPVPTRESDCVVSMPNPAHTEGYDNISLLTPQKYAPGAAATLRCGFEGLGCPEIILVPEAEPCPDGATRYGACFEVVLYKNGINVWRHYRENGACSWHKRLGWEFPLAQNTVHTLRVATRPQYLDIWVNDAKTTLRVDDLPQSFHFGVTLCEGVARAYSLEIQE